MTRPTKSLRTLLMFWLILFSVLPLAFITYYSITNYESSIDSELQQRLSGNHREFEIILSEIQTSLLNETGTMAQNKQLVYHLSKKDISEVRSLLMLWMAGSISHKVSLFNNEGRLEVSLYKDKNGTVKRKKRLESTDVYLSENYNNRVDSDEKLFLDFKNKKRLDLIVFHRITTEDGGVVGTLLEVVHIEEFFLNRLKKRLNAEVAILADDGSKMVASHDDLELYGKKFYSEIFLQADSVFNLNIQGVPFGFVTKSIPWGKGKILVSMGASKKQSQAILKKVSMAFYIVFVTIVLLLLILSFFISKIILQPVSDLVNAISDINFEKGGVKVNDSSQTELGLLARSFNDMSERIYVANSELKQKVLELEKANGQIKETQTQLVHTAKMASLGQLVAGVAHELNNPIAFIYSNMAHLKEYGQGLRKVIEAIPNGKKAVEEVKQEVDYDFIVEDLPKLIKSCEDGAQRTRDIVVGLRNFSRLEEAKVKDVDINESIVNTMNLLKGETKGKVQIIEDFDKLPMIKAYPSQLNQVFMNIISNAIHAVEDNGIVTVRTKLKQDSHVVIQIEDNGYGMNEETKQKIFDPFFTTKKVGEGTGLGLSISYGIIQKHGGSIEIESAKGKGTLFTIELPIETKEVA